MNILLVSEHFHPHGGAELSLWRLCGVLTQRGHRIQVITARRRDETEYEVRDGIEVQRPFPTGNTVQRLIFAIRLYPYLSHRLRSGDIDIVYNLGYVPTLAATHTAARHNIPVVTLLSHLCGRKWFQLTNPLSALLNMMMESITIRWSKHSVLVVQCQSSASRVASSTTAATQVICNTFLEPNGIDKTGKVIDAARVRQALRIEKDEWFLLFVGALIPTKNAAALVKALARVNTRFRLVLIGDGPQRGKIAGAAKRLNTEDRVILLGQRPHHETLAIIRACDALVLPSICEQMPNVVLEALSLGRPVIATKVGGVPEIKSANLHLIDSLDEIGPILAGGIVAGREDNFAEEYSLENVAGKYESLFTELVGLELEAKRS
jgi:glycosyltransferase involved in cell wall biosynthesis